MRTGYERDTTTPLLNEHPSAAAALAGWLTELVRLDVGRADVSALLLRGATRKGVP